MNIEVNSGFSPAKADIALAAGALISITPPIDAGYFIARVPLFADQAIVVFPKFGTIGCGFAQEEDWNTNLPITTDAQAIYNPHRPQQEVRGDYGRTVPGSDSDAPEVVRRSARRRSEGRGRSLRCPTCNRFASTK